MKTGLIEKPNHLSYNFNNPSQIYLQDNKRTFLVKTEDKGVSSRDPEEEDALEDGEDALEDENDGHDDSTSSGDLDEDQARDIHHDKNGDADNIDHDMGAAVLYQEAKEQSVSSDVSNEDNYEIEPDYMENFDEGDDDHDEAYENEEGTSEELLDNASTERSMPSEILDENGSEVELDYMELDDVDDDDDGDSLLLGVRAFGVHNLQWIFGNPEPDDRLFNTNDLLPERILGFIHDLIPSHAQEPVLDYFRTSVPMSMCKQLDTLISSIPQIIQRELAIFITELSNVVGVAPKNTTIHVGVIFKRSDTLVQWVKSLTTQTIQLVVGIPFTGQQLLDIILTWWVRVNWSSVSAHGDNHVDIGEGYRERMFPRELPTQIKNLLSRLSVGCELEVIHLIINLPPSIKAGFATILGLAPPRIIDIILAVLEQCGNWHIYDAGTEDSALEVEQPEPTESNNENFEEEITILDPYSEIRDADDAGDLFSFLVGLPDEIFSPIWPIQNAGYHLCHMIARCQVVFDPDGQGSSFSTGIIARSANFRLELIPAAAIITTDDVRRIIGSLAPIPTEALTDDLRECPICTRAYCDPGLGDEDEAEVARRLPCGHIFGDLCLVTLLGEKIKGGFEHRSCPLCRAPLTDFLKEG